MTFRVLFYVLFCTLFALAPGHSVRAQTPEALSLTTGTDQYKLLNAAYLLEDPNNQFNLKTVISQFRNGDINKYKHNVERLSLGYRDTPFWLVFSVTNRHLQDNWTLNFGQRFDGVFGSFDFIEIYDLSRPETPVFVGGSDAKHISRTLLPNANAIPLTLPVNTRKTYVMYIDPSPEKSLSMPITLETHNFFLQKLQHTSFFTTLILVLGTIFGSFFILIALIKDNKQLFMLGGYAFLQLFVFYFSGIVISNTFDLNYKIYWLFFAASFFVGIGMTASLLDIKKEDRLTFGALICGGAVLLLTSPYIFQFFPATVTARATFGLVSFLILLFIALGSAAKIPEKGIVAVQMTVAWAILSLGSLVKEMALWEILPEQTFYLNGYWSSFVLHFMVLSYTLYSAHKKHILRQEKARQEQRQKLQHLKKLEKQKEAADQERLIKVLQRERELMSELREREAERSAAMRHAKEVADQANKAKSAFLAVISHEIRTPMTGIMGMIRLLLETHMNDKQREYAETIQYSGDALLALLNDILDFSKIEDGRMEIESLDFDLVRLVESVNMLMSGRADEKRVELKCDVDDNVPAYLKGDPTRLRQVLLNLVGNAIKFTEGGSVTVKVRLEDASTEERPLVYFGVIDTGIGISEEGQKDLFNPFSQASPSISRRFGGTGLGLAICKRLVTAMGGQINLKSKLGRGSTFYFSLPFEIGRAEDLADGSGAAAKPVTSQRVLVVDDNAINQKVVAGLLENDGHTIDTCSNGEDAIVNAKLHDYDVILMDMEMPVMNGLEATEAIRALEDNDNAHIPIIAMTANVMKEDVQRCEQAGMNDYISKPIDPETLRRIMRAVAEGTIGTPPTGDRRKDHKGDTLPAASETKTPQKSFYVEEPAEEDTEDSAEDSAKEITFDKDMLAGLRDSLGTEVLKGMIDDLNEKTEELIAALESAFAEGNMNTVIARAHELKGMTGNFGLTQLSKISGRIEDNGKKSPEKDMLTPDVSALAPAYEKAKSKLAAWLELEDE